ncbi:MAG: hypothetical protein ACE5IP_09060 [Terriglobia bacterium]
MRPRAGIQTSEIKAAILDLERRTLDAIPGEFGRLVFLASTRDYNTGAYCHDGLAAQFTEQVARRALAACHRDTFGRLLSSTLEEFVRELEGYLGSTGARPGDVLDAWEKFEPYRVTIPSDCDLLSGALFFSNVRTALAILRARRATRPEG